MPDQVVVQGANRAEFEVALEDVPDDGGILCHDGQAVTVRLVTNRRGSAHPHAALLGGRNATYAAFLFTDDTFAR